MNPTAIDFQALSVAERIQLAEDLWDSIATGDPAGLELTAEQKAEIGRRLEAHRRDPSSAVPWEQVRSELSRNKR